MPDSLNLKPEADTNKSEILQYWQKMFDDLKDWDKVADNRASAIISVNSILLGFMALSTVLKLQITKNGIEEYLLAGFFFTVMFSICLAIYSLWGRKKFCLSFWTSNRNLCKKNGSSDDVLIFFGDIIDNYKANNNNKAQIGEDFAKLELNKYASKDNMLKAMATQIVILSSHLYSRFWILNFSYILIVISIVLMSVFAFVTFVLS